eukprot:scaffold2639_cov361-Pavlova_lutheri.AAC.62
MGRTGTGTGPARAETEGRRSGSALGRGRRRIGPGGGKGARRGCPTGARNRGARRCGARPIQVHGWDQVSSPLAARAVQTSHERKGQVRSKTGTNSSSDEATTTPPLGPAVEHARRARASRPRTEAAIPRPGCLCAQHRSAITVCCWLDEASSSPPPDLRPPTGGASFRTTVRVAFLLWCDPATWRRSMFACWALGLPTPCSRASTLALRCHVVGNAPFFRLVLVTVLRVTWRDPRTLRCTWHQFTWCPTLLVLLPGQNVSCVRSTPCSSPAMDRWQVLGEVHPGLSSSPKASVLCPFLFLWFCAMAVCSWHSQVRPRVRLRCIKHPLPKRQDRSTDVGVVDQPGFPIGWKPTPFPFDRTQPSFRKDERPGLVHPEHHRRVGGNAKKRFVSWWTRQDTHEDVRARTRTKTAVA